MHYNANIVTAWFKEHGIEAVPEYKFHPSRKWRFDFGILQHRLAIECQGGIFTNGRHTRGAALLKEMEKLNAAAQMGWRVLYYTPSNLCMQDTIDEIKAAMSV